MAWQSRVEIDGFRAFDVAEPFAGEGDDLRQVAHVVPSDALRRAGREADAVAVEVLLARNDYGGTDREVRDGLAATAVRAAIESGNLYRPF